METSETLGGIAQWAVDLMDALGAPGAAIAIAAENLFPPLPSEIILPLAGFAASRGSLGLVEVIIWTTIGSIVGALALYGLGRWLGAERLKRIADRMPLVQVSDVDRAEAWFAKHGGKAVFFGRMIPIFRSLISIPAGLERMPVWRFLLLSAAGSAIWNTVFVVAGFQLGEHWHIVEDYAGVFQKIVIAVVVIAVAVWIALRVRRIRRERRDTAPTGR
ncbi:DedA family protein [Agromyces archimandritae]|uniref:DedA family protein n=1 Tax=Agromyces archimandritae TaxID=2781962 RepID=A0A975FM17_9MICO|nr:DedA family protein [Agromyces archimandritae]QTX04935.1 DedA family protein [Agromyces archimandritae]